MHLLEVLVLHRRLRARLGQRRVDLGLIGEPAGRGVVLVVDGLARVAQLVLARASSVGALRASLSCNGAVDRQLRSRELRLRHVLAGTTRQGKQSAEVKAGPKVFMIWPRRVLPSHLQEQRAV